MRTQALIVAATAVFVLMTRDAFAQTTIRDAGNELRFRVIQRFPPADSVAWPWPEATRSMVDRGAWKSAWTAIQPKPVKEPDARFLYGYVAWRAGDHQAAYDALDNFGSSNLSDYANLYAAYAARELKRPADAARLAAQVSQDAVIYSDSAFVLAMALLESKDSVAERALRGFVGTFPKHSRVPEATLALGSLLNDGGQSKNAAAVYHALIETHPLSSEASEAQTALTTIAAKLSAADRARFRLDTPKMVLARHRALFAAHRSDDVVSGLGTVSKTWKKGPSRCEATFLVGRSLTKLRKHTESVGWYSTLRKECKGTPWEIKALYLGGKGLWNAGKRDEALVWFKEIWTRFPSHSFADDALYFSSRIHRDENRADRAAKLLNKQITTYPAGDMAKDAHWLVVRGHFAKKEYKAVVKYVDGLKSIPENDVYTRGRLHYFRARALELSGDKKGAKSAYTLVAQRYPLSHYALFALNRVFAGDGEVCRGEKCPIPIAKHPITSAPSELKRDPRFVRANALLALKLSSLARRELASLRRAFSSPEKLWALADLLDQAGAYPVSHDIPRRLIKDWSTSAYPEPAGSRQWTIAFPRPFYEDVKKWTDDRKGVDPALTYAIMREESGFSPGIESWANARGLMQLMEKTGERIAKTEGLKNFSTSDLFEPSTGIRLGTAYLDELAGQLENHPALVIAGYNGGHGNVSKWLKAPESADLDLWIEDIPFGQTRKYTKRVLQSFWTYGYLYERGVVPRVAMTVPQ